MCLEVIHGIFFLVLFIQTPFTEELSPEYSNQGGDIAKSLYPYKLISWLEVYIFNLTSSRARAVKPLYSTS